MADIMNTGFNGMLESTLPNVYIKRVSLQQADFVPEKLWGNYLAPYIDESDLRPEDTSFINEQKTLDQQLKVTFNSVIKVPNANQNAFLDYIFDDDFIKYIKFRQIIFWGTGGREFYQDLIADSTKFAHFVNDINSGNLHELNIELTHTYTDLGYKVGPLKPLNTLQIFDSGGSGFKLDDFKTRLPDGKVVYELPIETSFIVPRNNPSNLCTLAFTTIDFDAIWDKFSAQMGSKFMELPPEISANSIGKLAGEVIIKDNKVQRYGMVFAISANQGADADRAAAFGSKAGQIWLGPVHKMLYETAPAGRRYMAGNTHTPGELRPFLDPIFVENDIVQDFRQITRIKKQMVNFTAIKNEVFGGQTNFSSSKKKDFNELAIFSPLLTSRIKQHKLLLRPALSMFFGIDIGNLIKRHCAIPSVIDFLSKDFQAENLNNLFKKAQLLKLNIYRKRTDISDSVISSDSNKKLVYASNITGTGNDFSLNTSYQTKFANGHYKEGSTLLPVSLDPGATDTNGFYYHYVLTDYDVKEFSSGGIYEYSIEIELLDPTIEVLKTTYTKLSYVLNSYGKDGLNQYLKKALAPNVFNASIGSFRPGFIEARKNDPWGYTDAGIPQRAHDFLKSVADNGLYGFATVMRLLTGRSGTFGTEAANLITMLKPKSATPDSIIACIEILETMALRLKKIINAYASVKNTKTPWAHETAQLLSLAGAGAMSAALPATRKISLVHAFKEKVDGRHPDAGYDFLGGVQNQAAAAIGLKFIGVDNYKQRLRWENKKYFTNAAFDEDVNLTIPYNTKNISHLEGAPGQALLPFNVPLSFTAYSYISFPPEGGLTLPDNIATPGHYNELATPAMVTNILRYKKDLLGDYKPSNQIFEDPRLKNKEGPTEKVFKMIQYFASQGVVFKDDKTVLLEEEDAANTPNLSFNTTSDELGSDNQPAESPPLSPSTGVQAIAGAKSIPDIKLQALMTSLINESAFLLDSSEMLLAEYDPSLPNSKINIAASKESYANDKATTAVNRIAAFFRNLPNSIKSLIMNNTDPSVTNDKYILNAKAHAGLYNAGPITPKTIPFNATTDKEGKLVGLSVKPDRYAALWFEHFNLAKIEYLTGYSKYNLDSATQADTYEKKYNSSISSLKWSRLTSQIIDQIGDGKHILCRLQKYKGSFYNSKAYELLDLPLYNQYFMIFGGAGGEDGSGTSTTAPPVLDSNTPQVPGTVDNATPAASDLDQATGGSAFTGYGPAGPPTFD